MLRLIYFEWRKTYIRPSLVFITLIFSLINIFNIVYQYQRTSYFADSTGWCSAYWSLYPYYSGLITSEKANALMDLYRPLAEQAASMTFNTAHDENSLTGINQYSDYLFLKRFYITPMQRFVEYSNFSDTVSARALENIACYSKSGNHYEEKKNLIIYNHFYNRSLSNYFYTEPFDYLTRYTFSSYLVLLVCLLGSCKLFSQEYENDMLCLIRSTQNGNIKTINAKLIASCLFCAAISLSFYLIDFFTFCLTYGSFDGLSNPLYSLTQFMKTPFCGSIHQYLIFQAFSKIIALIPFSIGFCLLSSYFKNTFYPFLFGATISGLSLIISEFFQYTAMGWFKVINPSSLLRFKDVHATTEFINICGTPFLVGDAAFCWCLVLTIFLYILCLIYNTSKRFVP